MHSRLALGALGLLALLGACSSKTAACKGPADCDTGTVCDLSVGGSGSCIRSTGACAGGKCPAGFNCSATLGACVEGAAKCAAPDSCAAGQTCAGGACVCTGDSGCPSGETCSAAVCGSRKCSKDGDCPTGTICADATCVAGCRSGRDCPSATPQCDTSDGAHGKCVECLAPIDCGGAACTGGTCAPAGNVDVLFVVDNSSSMGFKQQNLAQAMGAFVTALAAGGMLPSLHVGIISTDVGAFPYQADQCSGHGDAGDLQNKPRVAGCQPPMHGARYIEDLRLANGGRMKNYDGELADEINCLAELGEKGCGFEQPLESMRLALSSSANSGFLRADAALAVVIVSDEDDCSARDTALFDPNPALDNINSTLGFMGSYRCTEFGVLCDSAVLPRTAGSYTSCVPRGDSYLYGPQFYVDYLRGLRPGARLIVGVLAGRPKPFAVQLGGLYGDTPTLVHSCESAGYLPADPAVRLAAFAAAFGDHGTFQEMCTDDYRPALTAIGTAIHNVVH
jgi:hypothetical protein